MEDPTRRRRYARRRFAIAYRILRQPQDAEDLVQFDPAESSEIRTRFRTALAALPPHEFEAVSDKVDGVLSPAQCERYHAMLAKPKLRFRPRDFVTPPLVRSW